MTADGYEVYLEYGEAQDGRALHISEARPGLECGLCCPHCGGALVAKNRKFSGRVKQPHFAHDKKTCRYFSRYNHEQHFRVPLYQNFTWNLPLSKNQRLGLQLLYKKFGKDERIFVQRKRKEYSDYDSAAQVLYKKRVSNCHQVFDFLKQEGFLAALPEDRRLYQLSKKGMIANGGLPLAQFYAIQRQAIDFERMNLEDALSELEGSRKKADIERRRGLETDRKIFEWTLERFARSQLYFLEIETADTTLHKIGITQRAVEERIKEIRQDIKNLTEVQDITPLEVLPAMSSVEAYFLLRFHARQFKFSKADPHHEYFHFPKAVELKRVRQELQELSEHNPITTP